MRTLFAALLVGVTSSPAVAEDTYPNDKYPHVETDHMQSPHSFFYAGGGSGRFMLFEVMGGGGYWIPGVAVLQANATIGWGASTKFNWWGEASAGYPFQFAKFPISRFFQTGDSEYFTDQSGNQFERKRGFQMKTPTHAYLVPEVAYENWTQRIHLRSQTSGELKGRYHAIGVGARLMFRTYVTTAWKDDKGAGWHGGKDKASWLFVRYFPVVAGRNQPTTDALNMGLAFEIPGDNVIFELHMGGLYGDDPQGLIGFRFSYFGGEEQ